jgi:AcrR family transcriptional regulator
VPRKNGVVVADGSQRRASFQRKRSHETKRGLVQAAMALWRTNGYSKTTVADICRAAGVSRGLFYFYFPAKEDILFEVGLLSTRAARKTVQERLQSGYDVESVIADALRSVESSMARNPRELIIETILEGYRQEHRILAGDRPIDPEAGMFAELFARAQQDGKLAADVDVQHLSYVAGMHVSEGVRHWAAGLFGDRTFSEVVSRDIAALIAGYNVRACR